MTSLNIIVTRRQTTPRTFLMAQKKSLLKVFITKKKGHIQIKVTELGASVLFQFIWSVCEDMEEYQFFMPQLLSFYTPRVPGSLSGHWVGLP